MNQLNENQPEVPAAEGPRVAGPAATDARINFLETELALVRAEFSRFSSRLSHDLQGIFRNIDGFACALLERTAGKLTETEARYLQRIQAGARRGDSLMRDLASLSAVAVAQVRPSPVDLAALVDQCIHDLSPALQGRTVHWEIAGRPWPLVVADPALLRLALDHLLGNAVKFTRDRAPACIRITMAASPHECAITVADNGAGFDAAYVDRLFNVFERLHLPTEFDGNGVGLAVVKTVALRHGGRVRAEAPPEGGAIFTLALQPHNGCATMERAHDQSATGGVRARLKILVVDDEPMVLTTLQLMLERDGHEVVTANGGAAALEALEQQMPEARPFDLLMSDWSMPQVGGAEVVKAAKAIHPAMRVIVLTGQRPDIHDRHHVPAGVDSVVGKPVTPVQLRRAVAAATGQRHSGD